MKEPRFLKQSDEVEIYVQNVGTLEYSVSYEERTHGNDEYNVSAYLR